MTGTIKTTVYRGFGFITGPAGKEFFFHLDDCGGFEAFRALTAGDEVTFQAVWPQPEKGPRACDVVKIEPAAVAASVSPGDSPDVAPAGRPA